MVERKKLMSTPGVGGGGGGIVPNIRATGSRARPKPKTSDLSPPHFHQTTSHRVRTEGGNSSLTPKPQATTCLREGFTAQEPDLLTLRASWRPPLTAQLSEGREPESSDQTVALPLLLCDLQFFFQPSVYFLEEKNVYKKWKKISLK